MSDIRANTISDTSGNGPINLHKQSAAKAFGGVGSDAAIQTADSLNLSTTSDEGSSLYKYNFTSPISNPATFSANAVATNVRFAIINGRNADSVTVRTRDSTFTQVDTANMITAFGDLA